MRQKVQKIVLFGVFFCLSNKKAVCYKVMKKGFIPFKIKAFGTVQAKKCDKFSKSLEKSANFCKSYAPKKCKRKTIHKMWTFVEKMNRFCKKASVKPLFSLWPGLKHGKLLPAWHRFSFFVAAKLPNLPPTECKSGGNEKRLKAEKLISGAYFTQKVSFLHLH